MGPELIVTVPTCQKPPMPMCVFTRLTVFCAGPIGPAGISPAQDQLPSKGLSCAISGAGGGCGIAAAAGAAGAFAAGLAAAPALVSAKVQGTDVKAAAIIAAV